MFASGFYCYEQLTKTRFQKQYGLYHIILKDKNVVQSIKHRMIDNDEN